MKTIEPFQIERFLENDISLFLVIFSITIVGSFTREIFSDKRSKKRTSLKMIYASALVVSVLLFSLSDYIFKYFPGRVFIGVCIVVGLLSVEVTRKLTTISGVKKFISDFIEFTKGRKGG